MKKYILFIIVGLFSLQAKSQFLNSIAFTAGGSIGNQKYFFKDPVAISNKKYILGVNFGVFGEFFTRDYIRWVTEFQFNQKGSVDKQLETNYTNNLNYICWNNYLKFRYEMYNVIPYILVGPRLEYTFSESIGSPFVTDKFLPLHISGAVGGGVEFISYSNFKFFVEAFYNPDIMPAFLQSDLYIKNKNFEARIGLKCELSKRKEHCNTPTYVE